MQKVLFQAERTVKCLWNQWTIDHLHETKSLAAVLLFNMQVQPQHEAAFDQLTNETELIKHQDQGIFTPPEHTISKYSKEPCFTSRPSTTGQVSYCGVMAGAWEPGSLLRRFRADQYATPKHAGQLPPPSGLEVIVVKSSHHSYFHSKAGCFFGSSRLCSNQQYWEGLWGWAGAKLAASEEAAGLGPTSHAKCEQWDCECEQKCGHFQCGHASSGSTVSEGAWQWHLDCCCGTALLPPGRVLPRDLWAPSATQLLLSLSKLTLWPWASYSLSVQATSVEVVFDESKQGNTMYFTLSRA